jgi:exodeoxyribonuclease III
VRIVSYNVRDGGGDRLDLIAEVIRAQDVDAIAIQEATPFSAQALAEALSMASVFGEGNSIFDLHVAWLSRLPILGAHNHRLPALSKTLLEIRVGDVALFATHLSSRHEADVFPREREVAAILEVLATASRAHLLVGDFNALRPDDAVGRPPAGVEPRGDALPGASRLVLEPLADAGYADCYRSLHPTRPGWTHPAAAPWLRLDYAFASPALAPRVRCCDVIDTEPAARASDHLPLLVDVRDDEGLCGQ